MNTIKYFTPNKGRRRKLFPHEFKHWFGLYSVRFITMQKYFEIFQIPADIFRVIMWFYFQLSAPNLNIIFVTCGDENTFVATKTGLIGCGSNRNLKLGIDEDLRGRINIFGSRTSYTSLQRMNYDDDLCSVACFEEGMIIHTDTKVITYEKTPFMQSDLDFLNLTPTDIHYFHSTSTFRNSLFVLTKVGLVFGCGQNGSGILGLGHKNPQIHLTQINIPSSRIVSIDCKTEHALALTIEGVLFSCGSNIWGQLGLGM